MLKSVWADAKFGGLEDIVDEYGKFFKYKVSTVYWPGSNGPSSDKAGIPESTYFEKENLKMVSTKGGEWSIP